MITVNLQGGIGNTLFQYAYARTLTLCGVHLYNACNQYGCQLERFNIKLPFTKRPEGRWISERGLTYDQNPEVDNPCVLNGYWQCENYFRHIADSIKEEFTLKEEPSVQAKQHADEINKTKNSVMVHVRRGDYLTWARERHGVLPVEYYIQAAKYFTDPHFFLFSDDPSCSMPFPHTRVSCLPHEDLWLMSKCKNAVIANSSFSWWGAWLGADATGTVIAPKKWFAKGNEDSRDIVPSRWTQI